MSDEAKRPVSAAIWLAGRDTWKISVAWSNGPRVITQPAKSTYLGACAESAELAEVSAMLAGVLTWVHGGSFGGYWGHSALDDTRPSLWYYDCTHHETPVVWWSESDSMPDIKSWQGA